MICKHFNLSVEYINEEMLVFPDWYVCVSVAIDAEEEEWHNRQYLAYISAGGDPKKFPKRRKPYLEAKRDKTISVHNTIMNALGTSNIGLTGRKGSVEELAEARKLQKVYQLPDGTFVDKDGKKVEPTAGSVFVKSERG